MDFWDFSDDLLASADGEGVLNVWSMSTRSVICTLTEEKTWTEKDVVEDGVSIVWLHQNHTLVAAFPKSKSFKHVKLAPTDSR